MECRDSVTFRKLTSFDHRSFVNIVIGNTRDSGENTENTAESRTRNTGGEIKQDLVEYK